jgi:methylenetetrahydrofolate reductase (NADPH)
MHVAQSAWPVATDRLRVMVTVRDRLAAPGPHFSVEFFPPRDDPEEATLWLAIRRLEPLRPAFVSVTYGAGGSRRDRTIRITERIAAETTLLPVAHLTAVGHSVAELRHVIGSYASVGVRNILALRGDPPGTDPTAEWLPHPQGLHYASDLVALAKSLGEFHVGVAAFPDKHPRSPDFEADTRYFAEKVAAGADYAITQMLFSAADYVNMRDRAVAAGADVPILPGIMPVTSYTRLMRILELSGQRVPVDLAEQLKAVEGDPAAGRAIGMEHAIRMCEQLLAEGAPSLHFYTFNRSKATLEVLHALGIARVPALQT